MLFMIMSYELRHSEAAMLLYRGHVFDIKHLYHPLFDVLLNLE